MCGKEIKCYKSVNKKFCTKECLSIWQSKNNWVVNRCGKNNPAYIGKIISKKEATILYIEKMMSLHNIAKLKKVSVCTIQARLKSYSIPIRDFKEQAAIELATPRMRQMRKDQMKKYNPMKGKKMSLDSRKKMSIARKNRITKHTTREKMSKAHSGSKSHFWKGGKSKISMILRDYYKYGIWRTEVFKRDNYMCTKCKDKATMGRLNAHHIKSVSDIIDFYNLKNINDISNCNILWDIDNGITLCKECHKKLHMNLNQ